MLSTYLISNILKLHKQHNLNHTDKNAGILLAKEQINPQGRL